MIQQITILKRFLGACIRFTYNLICKLRRLHVWLWFTGRHRMNCHRWTDFRPPSGYYVATQGEHTDPILDQPTGPTLGCLLYPD